MLFTDVFVVFFISIPQRTISTHTGCLILISSGNLSNISKNVDDKNMKKQKLFQTKVVGYQGGHLTDLAITLKTSPKVNLKLLNGNHYFLLHILVFFKIPFDVLLNRHYPSFTVCSKGIFKNILIRLRSTLARTRKDFSKRVYIFKRDLLLSKANHLLHFS